MRSRAGRIITTLHTLQITAFNITCLLLETSGTVFVYESLTLIVHAFNDGGVAARVGGAAVLVRREEERTG